VAPNNGLALQLYNPVAVETTGGLTSAVQLLQPGNPDLKPEQTQEWEGGVDLGFLGNRLSVEFTTYYKTTQDALYSVPFNWDLSYYPYEVNIGEIRNTGLEGQVTAVPIESRTVTWTVTVNASVNHNLLVHLAPGLAPLDLNNEYMKPGYPLYGYWANTVHYADANHDGILQNNEVTMDSTRSYQGSSIPTQQASFDTHLGLFHGVLSVGALLNYQGGYKVYNENAENGAIDGLMKEQNVAGESLPLQARDVAVNEYYYGTPSGFYENGTVLRFQELSLTYAIPAQWARAAHVRNVSLTAAVRNLAFWTTFTGGDPAAGDVVSKGFNSAGMINNDLRQSDANAVPLARYFQFRLNVGF
jgi:outer membrane receptor protein involved in Fe transport